MNRNPFSTQSHNLRPFPYRQDGLIDSSSNSLQTISSANLVKKEVAPPIAVVEGIIPQGVTLFGASSKHRRPWLVDLAVSVSTGRAFLSRMTMQTGVVFLSNEEPTLFETYMRKTIGDRKLPENLFILPITTKLHKDLLWEISNAIRGVSTSIGLIILDNLREDSSETKRAGNAIPYSTNNIWDLVHFAEENQLCCVLTHRLTKGDDKGDPVNRIFGPPSIAEAADTIITLTPSKCGEDETKMFITGRDVIERTLVVKMDWSNYRWIYLGDERDVKRDWEEYEFKTILS